MAQVYHALLWLGLFFKYFNCTSLVWKCIKRHRTVWPQRYLKYWPLIYFGVKFKIENCIVCKLSGYLSYVVIERSGNKTCGLSLQIWTTKKLNTQYSEIYVKDQKLMSSPNMSWVKKNVCFFKESLMMSFCLYSY